LAVDRASHRDTLPSEKGSTDRARDGPVEASVARAPADQVGTGTVDGTSDRGAVVHHKR
jgi:hypothetical protein